MSHSVTDDLLLLYSQLPAAIVIDALKARYNQIDTDPQAAKKVSEFFNQELSRSNLPDHLRELYEAHQKIHRAQPSSL